MSTSALRLLVEKADEKAFRDVLGTDMATSARKELEAIELAARAFSEWAAGTTSNDAGPTAAIALMETIAKEAP